MKFIVLQMGARRDYEVARTFEQLGMLSKLYTDLALTTQSVFHSFAPMSAGITNRTVREIPAPKIVSNFLPTLIATLGKVMGVDKYAIYVLQDGLLGFGLRLRGLGDATHIYSMGGNGGYSCLKWAKSRGATLVVELFITPREHGILRNESLRWAHWNSKEGLSARNVHRYERRIASILSIADEIWCPSSKVGKDVASDFRNVRAKIRQMPYGLGTFKLAAGQPQPKRVLFAGHSPIRKGLPYLAGAASILRRIDKDYEIRVAGDIASPIQILPECQDLTFLGKLSREQMMREFMEADVFCLPSLAEGLASVTLEAMSAGIPCVVTEATGAPITAGLEGFVVPERDAISLANAISAICGDRNLRNRMGLHALTRIESFTKSGLQTAIASLLDSRRADC